MKRQNLSDMSVKQLVQLFVDLSVQQDMALLSLAQDEVNKLYWKIEAIEEELKSRPDDQRSALLPLFEHKNKLFDIFSTNSCFEFFNVLSNVVCQWSV